MRPILRLSLLPVLALFLGAPAPPAHGGPANAQADALVRAFELGPLAQREALVRRLARRPFPRPPVCEEPCRSNADCPRDQICFPPTHTCQAECTINCLVPDPVCGSDGTTYSCGELDAHCHGAEVEHEGECEPEPCASNEDCADGEICFPPTGACQPPCTINCLVPDPVCGTDGETYSCGELEAQCHGAEVEHRGPCDEPAACGSNGDCAEGEICFAPTETCQPPCDIQCIREELVCGTDGVTYDCGAADAYCHGAEVAHEGRCGVPCICPRVYMPVCGTDGVTYGNACELRCAGVGMAYRGPCGQCACPFYYSPVCGEDGRTYGNVCEASCAGVELIGRGPCPE